MEFTPPARNCSLCPRLQAFREQNRAQFPDKFNAPVPSFGSLDAQLLIVGLAPGLKGANFSGRPFTGDYAGDLLYPTLIKFGWAKGVYGARPDDGLELIGARITNAVRCVPPQNKPTGDEEKNCLGFLTAEMAAMPNLKTILSLGLVSHKAVLKALGAKISAHKFAHGAVHPLVSSLQKQGSGDSKKPDSGLRRNDIIMLIDSYHCSRYNTNTGRLTTEMFEAVFEKIKTL
ncbi:MAG: uracil-DNA glycosylase [Alphaproteobacteria bacterium]|nr:uracil-DNA glycosylase [Alphaproteobacteria bacterium]